jgi:putative phage-type endonuclease
VTDLWREKVGLKAPTRPMNPAMRTGTQLESDIRRWYETTVGLAAEPLCAEHEVYPWLRGSLDGWVAPAGVVVEIKYARKEYHAEALAGRVPAAYRPQVLHQLILTGASACHYVSHNPRFDQADAYALVEHVALADELVDLP